MFFINKNLPGFSLSLFWNAVPVKPPTLRFKSPFCDSAPDSAATADPAAEADDSADVVAVSLVVVHVDTRILSMFGAFVGIDPGFKRNFVVKPSDFFKALEFIEGSIQSSEKCAEQIKGLLLAEKVKSFRVLFTNFTHSFDIAGSRGN